ncbi:DUF4332 domain-containing protein [Cyanobacterium stanieri LEGE 03274]|uniref:DUF4332 domain-containing protein n=1 Tax=Cyanobacterium stanieri LEGE 03274 TaxID=1828756 RepID=A0ABR9V2B4_9CHRO|nr:DUF4332 domain-containing protein [Cyanobacterium stanieri]MBE9222023.1 DUF4332 domain-containing protein [Cyanobacterium stanieri LEGE 03274]
MILSVAIAQLPGIHPLEVKQLQSHGIQTNIDLLKSTTNPQQKTLLASKMGLNIKLLSKWVALSNLACAQSIGTKYCGLLLHAGIPSLKHLSTTSAPQLHRQIMRLQVSTFKRKDLCPPISLVEQWIKEAKQLTIGKN